MNPDVIVRGRTNPPLLEVHDSAKARFDGHPPLLCTRIYMGIVGPEGDEPGYACVVGEIYDGDTRQKARKKIVLDEAQALRPDDIDPRQHDRYADLIWSEKRLADGTVQRIPKADHPTLEDLRQACCALKDLYWYEFHKADGGRLLAYAPPGSEPFVQYMRATEGLSAPYPAKKDPEQLKAWWPFFAHEQALTAIASEVPFGEDEEYARQLIESLLARDDIVANDHCTLFWDTRLRHPRRAAGLVCAAMQATDWSWIARGRPEDDGYEDVDMTEAKRRQMEEYCIGVEARLAVAGSPVRYPVSGAEYRAFSLRRLQRGERR